jgi:hypothetical protein
VPATKGHRKSTIFYFYISITPCHGLIKIKATKARLTLDQIAPIGWECWMKRDTLYFVLSVVWLVILAGGLEFFWFK